MVRNKHAEMYLQEILSKEKIDLLDAMGFFESPASSKHHLSVTGGLAQHSVNVTDVMLKINEGMNLGLKRKEIIMAGMLHDVCKAGIYKPNILKSGAISTAQPFKSNKTFTLGHSAESLYITILDLELKIPTYVAEAIYWHMGFNYDRDSYDINILKQNPISMLFVWLMQTADTFSTWITEGGKTNELES